MPATVSPDRTTPSTRDDQPLPLAALLVMALMGFVLIATETMPAGLLPQIADGMDISEGVAGQFVSAYALGTVLAAIPAVALTRGMRRKPVLLVAVVGFLVTNTIAALSPDVFVSLGARFVTGAFSGLLWGMLAGYARRISPPRHAGRALAIASVGTPVGLAVGTPFGSWLGATVDWRWSFGVLSVLTATVLVLALAIVPDAPGQRAASHLPLRRVVALPGVAPILAVILTWMLAHNVVYTYIASFLREAGIGLGVDLALVIFGAAALAGIVITGRLADRALRLLVLASIGGFVAAGAVLLAGHASQLAVVLAIALWGVAFGGAAAQVQTAMGEAAGENVDVANSLVGVSFNLAIFAAGVLGAVLLAVADAWVLPALMVALAVVALSIAVSGRRTAFPVGR